MLEWVIFALLGYIFFAGGNIVEKIIRTVHIKSPFSFAILLGAFESLFILLIPFFGINLTSWVFIIPAIGAGALRVLAFLPYAEALSTEEVSRLVPLWTLDPVFTLLMASFFLGESLTANFHVAFVLVLLGSVLLMARTGKRMFRLNRAFAFMVASSFLYALQAVLLKFAYFELSFFHGLIWVSIGTLITTVVILSRKRFREAAREEIIGNVPNRMLAMFAAFGLLGIFFINYAIKLGSVSIVEVMFGFQMVFVLVIATAFSFALPSFVRESVKLKSMSVKIFSIAIMLAGLFFLYY